MDTVLQRILLYLSLFRQGRVPGVADRIGVRTVTGRADSQGYDLFIRQDCAAWIRTSWLPRLSRLPEDRRSGFIEAVMEEYLNNYPADPDGTIHISMVRQEAEAKKIAMSLPTSEGI